MIAEVIVDVKTKGVNKPFTYIVPPEFCDIIEVGMRVNVPFGPRQIMGFVVRLGEEKENRELKAITDLLDLTPSLTDELIELAQTLSEDTASFLINCLQIMLPSALKTQIIKKVIKVSDEVGVELESFFGSRDEVLWDQIERCDLAKIKKGIECGDLELAYDLKDKARVQYEVYVSLNNEKPFTAHHAKKQKEVIEFLNQQSVPIIKSELIKNLKVASSTYKALLNKGFIIETKHERYRNPFQETKDEDIKHHLNEQQQKAFQTIIKSHRDKKQETFLLHGVTGSGKTEVYMNIIDEVIINKQQAIVLVPEISLTPQMVDLFKRRFGEDVAVLHSGLSVGEKYDEWRRIRRQEVRVVVGARSAIFAPFKNIGIIIIDEEHEQSYKQEEMPKYHAVEVAKIRAKYHQATLILGSATPSLESYARAIKGVYHLLELTKRATNMSLPNTMVVDMTEEYKKGNLSIISKALTYAIKEKLSKNEQIILLLNRRGYENFLLCRSCGQSVMCPNCDITLTHHKKSGRLKCHYCGYDQSFITKCPSCESIELKGFGMGTQKVEETLYALFPNVRIIRMDHDTTQTKGSHERLLTAFRNYEADILLGTQMIAKGLDFPLVTLVGVVSADTTLKLPDFRASEKTFQLITQVAGRAGRHKLDSDVIIQTYNPHHYSIVSSANHDYQAFFKHEMNVRKLGKYVPYYYLSQIIISDEDYQEMMKVGQRIADFLKKQIGNEAIILGPVALSIMRINNLYYTQIIIKYKNIPQLKTILKDILIAYESKKVNIIIDMYPHYLL